MPPPSEWEVVKSKVISPAEFDAKLKEPEFASSIAGVGTYNLSRLRAGMDPSGLSIVGATNFNDEQACVTLDLSIEMNKRVYPEKDALDIETEELVKQNRRHGNNWGPRDAAVSIAGTDAILNIGALRDNIADLLKYPVTSNPKLLDHLRNSLPHFQDAEKSVRIFFELKDLYYSVLGTFKTEDAFFTFLNEAQKRKGVQIVFGDSDEFTNFMKQSEHEECDDWATTIVGNIPSHLVKAIIPIGEYEQEQLGVK